MDPIIISFFGFLIAIYGAVLSTILAIRERQKDKTKVIIALEHITWVEMIQIIIINSGHRPITITNVGLSIGSKEKDAERVPQQSFYDSELGKSLLPITLTDGEHVTLQLDKLLSEMVIFQGVKLLVNVYDAEGNTYSDYIKRTYDAKWGYYHEG